MRFSFELGVERPARQFQEAIKFPRIDGDFLQMQGRPSRKGGP